MPEFARNHSGSIETQRNSRETTAGASKPRPRLTARAVAVGNLSGPPRRGLKRPREAGIRAKTQGELRNATEFAQNHSGSIETQRNSRETTAGASKPRPEEATRGRNSRETTAGASKCNGIRAKPQRQHRNATEFVVRNHSGSVETIGRQPKWPPQKRPEEAMRGRNSHETTAGASKRNGIRAKPQRERRNLGPVPPRAVAVGNLSGPPRRGLKRPREAGIRAKPQREPRNATEFVRSHSGSIETQRNSRETTAGASKPRCHRACRCGRQPNPPRQA